MDIHFTRHARNRIRLYRIDREQLLRILNSLDLKSLPASQSRTFFFEGVRSTMGTPIKVIAVRRKDRIVIRTNYPIKKGKKE
jgi:hypothetical protein